MVYFWKCVIYVVLVFFFLVSHILPQLWFRLIVISSNYYTTILRLCLAMGAQFALIKRTKSNCFQPGHRWHVSGPALLRSQPEGGWDRCGGSSPSSVGTMSAPTSSVCGHAPPCWAESINPSVHAATVTSTLTVIAPHKPKAKTHLVNDWVLTVDTRQPSFRPEFGAAWWTSSHSFASYLPTVWLASCLIRLNCFFILCVSVLPPDGRATSRISLIEWSQISALIYGRRQGSILKHPVPGNIDAKSSPFLLMGTAYLASPLRSGA